MKSKTRLLTQGLEDDAGSGGSMKQGAESKSAYRLSNDGWQREPLGGTQAVPSRSAAHTAHTNQRLKPAKLHAGEQNLDEAYLTDAGSHQPVGAAGKREPTTFIVSNEGEIGVRRRIESPKSQAPSSQYFDKRVFAHERTLSRFGSQAEAQEQQLMPPIARATRQASLLDRRQRTAKSYETCRIKNKYGMTLRGYHDASMYSSTNTPAIASARRPTLLQKYHIPERDYPSMDTESQGGIVMHDDGSGVLAEIEPFGWKIGLKAGGHKYQQEQERLRQQRQVQHLKHQRKQQRHLQRGIEKLMHNAHYRQMYEKFKGAQ